MATKKHRIMISLDDDDFLKLQKMATKNKVSKSNLISGFLEEPKIKVDNPQLEKLNSILYKIYNQLSKIGVNVNQVAYAVNVAHLNGTLNDANASNLRNMMGMVDPYELRDGVNEAITEVTRYVGNQRKQ